MFKLSVLVAVLPYRPWKPLVKHLTDQAVTSGNQVEVLIEQDSGTCSPTSGVKRQRLLNRAQGDYVAFVDDDDWVSDDYIARLLEGIATKPDVVTLNLQFNWKDYPDRVKEIWKFGLHPDNRRKGLMTANHFCAWRIDLARQVGWCPYLGYGDDQLWYQPLLASGLAQTEHHVDLPLYQHLFSYLTTKNQTQDRRNEALRYGSQGLKCYRDQKGAIFVESPSYYSSRLAPKEKEVSCISPQGLHVLLPSETLEEFSKAYIR